MFNLQSRVGPPKMIGTISDNLVGILIAVGLAMAVWFAVSIPAYIIKTVLNRLGLPTAPQRLFAVARTKSQVAAPQRSDRAKSTEPPPTGPRVTVVLDERHNQLKSALKRTDRSFHAACEQLGGLIDVAGPESILAEVRKLQEFTKEVAQMGGEIDDGLEEKYAARLRTVVSLVFVVILGLVFAPVNGNLLYLFFRDVFNVRVFGISAGALVSIAFVAGEMALGFAVSYLGEDRHRRRFAVMRQFLVLGIVVAALFESTVFGIVSYGFQLNIPMLDQFPVLKFWMAPLGVLFVTATFATGFLFHHTINDLSEIRGTRRLKREIAAVNAFVQALPKRWDRIAKGARDAESSIDSYLRALGGRAGALGGYIEQVRRERDELSAVIRESNIDNWPTQVQGNRADAEGSAAQNVGIALATALGIAVFSFAIGTLAAAADQELGAGALWIGLLTAFALYLVGFLPFDRVQVGQGNSRRVFPMRAGPIEISAAIIVVLGAAGVIIWISVAALGAVGLLAGLCLSASGGFLVIAGYFVERAARGVIAMVTGTVSVASATVGIVYRVIVFLFFSCLGVITWAFIIVLNLIASPIDLTIGALFSKSDAVLTGGARP